MIEIWQECARFQTSQRLDDQVRTIIKKGWFSDFEILEIHQKMNNEQDSNTAPDTSSINNENQPNRNQSPILENGNTTPPNNAQPNNPKQPLTQEQKVNIENLKRIMGSEKTTLPSLRNKEWKTVKKEMNKINQLLPYISTNHNRFKWTNLWWGEIGLGENWDPSKNTKKKSKPGWKIRLETQIKNTKTYQNDKTKKERWNV